MATPRLVIAALVVAAIAACDSSNSATDLHTDGPPKVEQVRLFEDRQDTDGVPLNPQRVFGFGTHPQASSDDAHNVTSGSAFSQYIRVIMDQLLRGNRLEEVECRGVVGTDGIYSRVPDGATPDDVALCAVASDALIESCKGPHAVCLCELDAGCMDGSGNMIAKGAPVGVQDRNQDGAADDTAMIPGVVGITCGSINVPLVIACPPGTPSYPNCNRSYWQPSGFQGVPAVTGGLEAGFELLGPAIVLVPAPAPMTATAVIPPVPGVLPTNSDCTLKFDASVVNKRGEEVCAPPGGDPDMPCTALDTSQIKWHTSALSFQLNMGIPLTTADPAFIYSNAALTDATVSNITVTVNGTAVAGVTFGVNSATGLYASQVQINPPVAGWPNGNFVITIPTTVKDAFGIPVPAPQTITFTL